MSLPGSNEARMEHSAKICRSLLPIPWKRGCSGNESAVKAALAMGAVRVSFMFLLLRKDGIARTVPNSRVRKRNRKVALSASRRRKAVGALDGQFSNAQLRA